MASATQADTTDKINDEMEADDEDTDKQKVLPDFSRKVSIGETSPDRSNTDTLIDNYGDDEDKGGKSMVVNEKSQEEKERGDKTSAIDNSGNKVQSPVITDSHPTYKCNCGEGFEKSTELAAHKRWTCLLVEKKLQCDICKSWFAHERSLRRHMKQSHQGDFSCSHCDLKFHNRVKLTRHWMECHYDDDNVDKKLKCFLCGEDSFRSKFELETHLLVHKYNRRQAKQKCRDSGLLHPEQPKLESIDLTKLTTGTSHSVSSSSQSPAISMLHSVDSTPSTPCWASASLNNSPNPIRLQYSHPCTSYGHHQQSQMTHQAKHSSSADTTPTTTSDNVDYSHNAPSLPPNTKFLPPPFLPHHSFPSHPHRLHHHHPHHHHTPMHHLPLHHSPPPHYPPPHHLPLHHPPPHHTPHHPPPSHTEPSSFPPAPLWQFIDSHKQHFPFFGKHLKGKHHHNRWKWKKYFKRMMCQQLPPPWTYGYYPQPSTSDEPPRVNAESVDNQSQFSSFSTSDSNATATKSTSFTPDPSELDSVQSSSSFKMMCKFCDQIIDKGKATQHRLHDCPFIPAFKCNVCDKVFRKRHKLLQHMIEFNHYLHDPNCDTDASEASSISNLYKRLDSALDLQNSKELSKSAFDNSTASKNNHEAHSLSPSLKPGRDSDQGFSTSKNINHSVCEPSTTTPDLASSRINFLGQLTAKKDPCLLETNTATDKNLYEESELVIDIGTVGPGVTTSSVLQCSLCHTVFDSVSALCNHLQSHITHVTSIQKVHEWKKKSSSYFLDSNNSKEESSVAHSSSHSKLSSDAVSVATSATSFQGVGGLSTHSSNLNTTVGSESVRTDGITDFEKWLKPHCKKKGKKRHKIDEIYRCEFCDESFSFKKNLARHVKEKHPDKKKKLECPVCHKKFSWKKRGQFFERHLSSHYGVTIFKHKCEICDKTFLEKGKLQAHMAVQHGKAEDLLHTCHLCGKSYGTKSSLTRHLRQHTGDKPHQCGICQASFLEKRELTRHMASHTGVPAFVCLQCGQGFTLKTSLDTHIKRKHSQPD